MCRLGRPIRSQASRARRQSAGMKKTAIGKIPRSKDSSLWRNDNRHTGWRRFSQVAAWKVEYMENIACGWLSSATMHSSIACCRACQRRSQLHHRCGKSRAAGIRSNRYGTRSVSALETGRSSCLKNGSDRRTALMA